MSKAVMIRQTYWVPLSLLVVLLVMMLASCSSGLPKGGAKTKSQWNSFEEAKASYDSIILNETTTDDLQDLGFDPYSAPNVRILSYLDIIQKFSPNSSVTNDDLPPSVRTCLKSREKCLAYEATPSVSNSKRVGNVVLDLLKFKRERIRNGWNFNALIVIDHNTVVYKIWSGVPLIDEEETRRNPLGPLQDSVGTAVRSGAE
ncbi:hypothetical protein [Porticoccus sp.]|uniref:hypothetical protein n=1 Tax=Porticoccus sp. TaxID=2024853 RepID=UPI003F69C4D8